MSAAHFPQHIIARKRDGHTLRPEEIQEFVRGATDGSWADYQLSALLMAIFVRGMNADETASYTEAMMRSGVIADLSNVTLPKADKHSTGGVGDKVSLHLAPMYVGESWVAQQRRATKNRRIRESSAIRSAPQMLASFLAALFFALSATCANRSLRTFGSARANLGRLIVATIILACFAHTLGSGFSSASVAWFFASGVIGMGLGDLGVFAALLFLGSRITVLITQCLAAPIAALGEWVWLGTTLSSAQILWGILILLGVAIALVPTRSSPPRVRVKPIGFLFGLIAAAGQGVGALLSRKGVEVAANAGEVVHTVSFGLNSAYLRILAGLIFTAVWFFVLHQMNRVPPPPSTASSTERRNGRLWLVANGLAGPVLGVGCYQWALATTPSGIVMPIAATTPLLAIPIAWWLEHDRPSRRSLLGAAVAVAGCIALTAAR